jgi:hypothetical protein
MKRPFGVTFLALIVVFAAVGNSLRLCEAIFFWKILKAYGAYPIYSAISGGFWLPVALFIAIGIWRGKTWAWAGTIISAVGYGSWYWIDRLALQVPHANWPFALALTVLFAGILALTLFNHKTHAYFNKQETIHQ